VDCRDSDAGLDGLIYEFACHEGNYGMANILKGARAIDGPAEISLANSDSRATSAREGHQELVREAQPGNPPFTS
jgi:hypothetical protein